jgi:hypothetical protein
MHFKPHHVFFLLLIFVAVTQEYVEKLKVLQSQWNPETHLLSLHSTWETSVWYKSVAFCDHALTFWASRVHTLFCVVISLSHSCVMVLDTLGMMWCYSVIVLCWFTIISASTFWTMLTEIKDGLPLHCSLWTSILLSDNSQLYFQHIMSPKTAPIFLISTGLSPCIEKPYDPNAPHILRDFGSTLLFQTRLT